jgi:hypothetical protein
LKIFNYRTIEKKNSLKQSINKKGIAVKTNPLNKLVVSLSSRNEITLSDLSKFTSIIMSKPPY